MIAGVLLCVGIFLLSSAAGSASAALSRPGPLPTASGSPSSCGVATCGNPASRSVSSPASTCVQGATNTVWGNVLYENGNGGYSGAYSQSIEITYWTWDPLPIELSQFATTGSYGYFCFALIGSPISGEFSGPGGPYSYEIQFLPINTNPVQNPGWTNQAAAQAYWSTTLFTSNAGNTLYTSLPVTTDYYSLVDYPDTWWAQMSISESNSISSTTSYSFAGNGATYSYTETYTTSWASYCKSGVGCILSEMDSVQLVGGTVAYAQSGSGPSVAWTYVYGTVNGGPVRNYDHYTADPYSLSNLPPHAVALYADIVHPGAPAVTHSIAQTYATSSQDGLAASVGVNLGPFSVSVDLSSTNGWGSSSSTTFTWSESVPSNAGGCYEFYSYQEEIPVVVIPGITLYYPGPVHVWTSSSPVDC